MALVSGRSSALNPNAPLFIPAALRQVEDFSPQWWELVKSSTWFRDYWLSQNEEEDFGESGDNNMENLLSETFNLGVEEDIDFLEDEFEKFVLSDEAQECLDIDDPVDERKVLHVNKDASALVKILSPKERGPKSPIGSAKQFEKPAQHVNIKCAPQRIHQPR